MKTTHLAIDCRWDPDTDLNAVGPCEDPDHPSRVTKRRHRLLLNMLLLGNDLTDARKILSAYPYLQSEYAGKIRVREEEIRRAARLEQLRALQRVAGRGF